jgi:small subunit ribosomal protein S16
MAVHLRLSRHGTRNRPFFHLVAADHRKARDGRFIEKLGIYDPGKEPSLIDIKEERVQFWYGRGAHLSDTVAKLLKIKNVKLERPKTASKKKKA